MFTHHRSRAVIHLRFLAWCRLDHDASFRHCMPAQLRHKPLRAVIAAREPMAIDEVLPDPHRIAPARQRRNDQFAIGLAHARRGMN